MALQVGLVHHIDAVPVAQVIPCGLIGVVAGAHSVDSAPLKSVYRSLHVRRADGPSSVRVPLVAVDPVEHQPFPIEEHQAIFPLEPAEAGAIRDYLCQFSVRRSCAEQHLIQLRVFVAPGEDIPKTKRLTAEIFSLRGKLQKPVKQYALAWVGDMASDCHVSCLPLGQQADGQRTGGVVLLQPRLEP